MRCVLAVAAIVASFSFPAGATIFATAPTVTPLGGGLFQWDYVYNLVQGERMRQVCITPCGLANDFVTLFDFPGFVAGSATLSNALAGRTFTLTEQAIGINPPSTVIPDTAALNITVALTAGGDINAATANIALFTLSLQSTFPSGPNPTFPIDASQTMNLVTGLTKVNVGGVIGPDTTTPSGDIPEPGTWLLSGLGLGTVLLARRRRWQN